MIFVYRLPSWFPTERRISKERRSPIRCTTETYNMKENKKKTVKKSESEETWRTGGSYRDGKDGERGEARRRSVSLLAPANCRGQPALPDEDPERTETNSEACTERGIQPPRHRHQPAYHTGLPNLVNELCLSLHRTAQVPTDFHCFLYKSQADRFTPKV